jgi:hypothetical protein
VLLRACARATAVALSGGGDSSFVGWQSKIRKAEILSLAVLRGGELVGKTSLCANYSCIVDIAPVFSTPLVF